MRAAMVSNEGASGETKTQEHVYQQYLPLVQSLARRIHRRVPQNVEFDDLVSAGMLGLLEASAKFDPVKNVDFSSYAYRRIQGAIVDSLRDLDWAPRGLRRRSREIQEAIRALSARLRRNPSEDEIATELQIPLSEYQYLLGQLASLEIGSLHRKAQDDSGDEEFVYVSGPEEDSPLLACLRGEQEIRLSHAIEQLPDIEKRVVHLYFNEGKARTEIAQLLGLSTVEVGRIRASAILSLRAAMKGISPKARKALIPFRRSIVKQSAYRQPAQKAA
ncbi:sigma-70 family RNA polymerase sigma factor [Acidicapsa dinghuensis]|uniref:Sigma-70 family RNA polymerase sigma factor n=1 Tax=Acidicapsa dinghuensis TaxID=2218256 RepID=A0ABW1EMR3_9BACT|nr:FliA/WhiG family RNA polymerase sigma factor [Acidicapsa dinghuensis]